LDAAVEANNLCIVEGFDFSVLDRIPAFEDPQGLRLADFTGGIERVDAMIVLVAQLGLFGRTM